MSRIHHINDALVCCDIKAFIDLTRCYSSLDDIQLDFPSFFLINRPDDQMYEMLRHLLENGCRFSDNSIRKFIDNNSSELSMKMKQLLILHGYCSK